MLNNIYIRPRKNPQRLRIKLPRHGKCLVLRKLSTCSNRYLDAVILLPPIGNKTQIALRSLDQSL